MTAINYIESLKGLSLRDANAELESICGIPHFFNGRVSVLKPSNEGEDREQYGDWQTNMELSLSICRLLKSQGVNPEVVVEPTCGKGNFILAALQTFDSIKEIYGIEINGVHIDTLKIRLLQYYIDNPDSRKVEMHLYNNDIFTFDFHEITRGLNGRRTLIIGNPPWVTNSRLGVIKGFNSPQKSNFKGVRGLDAMTGKGNFDISESICLKLFYAFLNENVSFAILLKNSVIKNIVRDQKCSGLPLSDISQYEIDARKEFGASVPASLLRVELGGDEGQCCCVRDFYTMIPKQTYGWVGDNFVASVEDYNRSSHLDGASPLEWRSGIKHDCSKVMELMSEGGRLVNGLGEIVDIEDEVVYPLVKSSNVNGGAIDSVQKYVIVSQHSTSDSTELLGQTCPKAYEYLLGHADALDARGSSIYRERPRFCLFGIGDYSFKPYKVVISGLYKHTLFSVVGPVSGKPVMVDDTCYLLGFDNREDAVITQKILNSPIVQSFIRSLLFVDAKRVVNKELLMRIDLVTAAQCVGCEGLGISQSDFYRYLEFTLASRFE